MSVKNSLTNEMLNDKFDNSFTLVNYAIKMARNLVSRGEEFLSNPANEVLERIVEGEDSRDEEEEFQLEEENEALV